MGKKASKENFKRAPNAEENSHKLQSVKRINYASSGTISTAFPRKHVCVKSALMLQYGRVTLCRLFHFTPLTEEGVGGSGLSWSSDFRVLT